jgi:hypothetical protein
MREVTPDDIRDISEWFGEGWSAYENKALSPRDHRFRIETNGQAWRYVVGFSTLAEEETIPKLAAAVRKYLLEEGRCIRSEWGNHPMHVDFGFGGVYDERLQDPPDDVFTICIDEDIEGGVLRLTGKDAARLHAWLEERLAARVPDATTTDSDGVEQ